MTGVRPISRLWGVEPHQLRAWRKVHIVRYGVGSTQPWCSGGFVAGDFGKSISFATWSQACIDTWERTLFDTNQSGADTGCIGLLEKLESSSPDMSGITALGIGRQAMERYSASLANLSQSARREQVQRHNAAERLLCWSKERGVQ